MKKLYVGNLSYQTTENELSSVFEKYGPLRSVKIISDKFSGESRGFGFVEIEADDMADRAIQEMNGASVDGKALKVNEARPMENRGGFSGERKPRREGGFRSDRDRSFGNRRNY